MIKKLVMPKGPATFQQYSRLGKGLPHMHASGALKIQTVTITKHRSGQIWWEDYTFALLSSRGEMTQQCLYSPFED